MIARPVLSLLSATALLTSPAPLAAQTPSDLTARIAEAHAFASGPGEAAWPGYGAAPFSLLVIEPDRERLLCHPSVPSGFEPMARDAATDCETWSRPRSAFPDTLLSAMPIFGPPSTIVVGTPASTGLGPAAWTRVLLHEHFHQWQSALPGYYDLVAALDLAGGDETGMWMLNFPFPYDNTRVVAAHRSASLALATAVGARGMAGFDVALADYLRARIAFSETVDERAWRYAELQLWQEGVARWTEIELGLRYPDPAVQTTARELEARTLAELSAPDLAVQRRLFAYSLGAGEAMLLEACSPGWRAEYPHFLTLGSLLDACLQPPSSTSPQRLEVDR